MAQADGEVIITNDGATILNKMKVEQPAAKMLVDLAKSQVGAACLFILWFRLPTNSFNSSGRDAGGAGQVACGWCLFVLSFCGADGFNCQQQPAGKMLLGPSKWSPAGAAAHLLPWNDQLLMLGLPPCMLCVPRMLTWAVNASTSPCRTWWRATAPPA